MIERTPTFNRDSRFNDELARISRPTQSRMGGFGSSQQPQSPAGSASGNNNGKPLISF